MRLPAHHSDPGQRGYPARLSRPTPFRLAVAVLISETMAALREEVKKIEETNWMHEGGEVHAVVKIRT